MNTALQQLAEQLTTYLTDKWATPVTVDDVEQISGGASRQTYRLNVTRSEKTEPLILRRDPATSLIDTERRWEFLTYEAVYAVGFPVPEALLLEEDETIIGRPFSLMRAITDCEAAVATLLTPPYKEHQHKIGTQCWSLLGQLSSYSIETLKVNQFMPIHKHPALHELEYWAEVVRTDQLHPQPIAEAAIRWLTKYMPKPSGDLCLVHGDYRAGNFLYNTSGDIKAILDWEMAHIGDPLEDLAWSLDPLWGQDKSLAGNLLTREQAIEVWENTSGKSVDREAFRWWQIFASLKGLAIWTSSSEDFANGASKEPILALAGWVMSERQNRILVDRLSPSSQHKFAEALV